MQYVKKIIVSFFSFLMKADFRVFFLLFMASIRSRPPGPPAVPGVLLSTFCIHSNLKFYLTLCQEFIAKCFMNISEGGEVETFILSKVVKTQLNHNQVKVGLTRLWVCNPPPTTTHQ